MEDLLIRYVHFLGIIILGSTLIFEFVLLKEKTINENFKRVCRMDIYYGLSAVLVITAGSMLWFNAGVDDDFYTHNPLFHIKLALFFLVALLSVFPTIYFIKNRKTKKAIVEVPKMVLLFIKLELVLFAFIPLLAVYVADGYGY